MNVKEQNATPPATKTRKKGAQGKAHADLKGMILAALSDVGGVAYLAKQAEETPSAFMGLVGKVLPKEVQLDLSARIAAMSPEEKLEEIAKMAVELGCSSLLRNGKTPRPGQEEPDKAREIGLGGSAPSLNDNLKR